jgi:RimJ/RimL family protein N-acetyltransferase
MLIGKHITLGPLVPEDFAPLFCWINDAAAAQLDYAYRPVDMMAHQQWWNTIGKDPTKVVFAIRKLDLPVIIGYVQMTGINPTHRCAEIGIRIGAEQHRNQGFGTEALRLAVDFCWNHLNLERVQLIVFKHNHRAISAYRAAGFKKEGVLRKAAFIGGAWVDVVPMAILRPAAKQQRRSPETQPGRVAREAAAKLAAQDLPHSAA